MRGFRGQGSDVRGQGSGVRGQGLGLSSLRCVRTASCPRLLNPDFGELSQAEPRTVNPLAMAAVIGLLLFSAAAFAGPPEAPQITGVYVGLADRYKVGLWTQVEIVLQGGSQSLAGELSAIVPDGDGVPSRVSTAADHPCRLQPGRETRVRLLCRFGRVHGTLRAEFCVDGKVVAQRTFETAASPDAEHFLPGLESQDLDGRRGRRRPWGWTRRSSWRSVEPEYRPATAHLDRDRATARRIGAATKASMRSFSRLAGRKSMANSRPTARRCRRWTSGCKWAGGSCYASARRPKKCWPPTGRFAVSSPAGWRRCCRSVERACWKVIVEAASAVPQVGNAPAALRVPRLVDVQGTVEAREADLPLVVRTPRGFGQVIFLAADLDQPPLDNWPDRPLLVAKLLDRPTGHGEEAEEGAAMMHYGYADLSGQLRSALDPSPACGWPRSGWSPGLIVGYLLLIGPGDYFFLRKLVGRMEWTWLSFPLVVVLAVLGAYVLAHRLKGDQLKVNQVDLVDVDAASGRLRGTAWLNVFSPRMEAFNLSVEPRLPDGRAVARRPPLDGLAGPARRGAGRHESPRRRTDAVDRALRLLAESGRDARRADPGVVDQEFHRPLDRSHHGLSPGRTDRPEPTADRHDHQHAGLPVGTVHSGLRRLGVRTGHDRAGRVGPTGADDQAERAEDAC